MPRRPPKEWFYYVVSELEKVKGVTDPKAVAGWLWHHGMKPETKKKILKGESLDPLRKRTKLTNKPKVLSYHDFKGEGLIRILWREKDLYPEFALYMPSNQDIRAALALAGFNHESKGKWVLRTNKFNIFVYL